MVKKYLPAAIIAVLCISLTGCSSQKAILTTAQEDETYTSNESAGDQTDSVSGNEPLQFESETEEIRPDYTASDYVIMPQYIGITVTNIRERDDSLIEAAVVGTIKTKCYGNGIEYESLDALTNEQCAILSGQKYQTSEDYIEAVRDMERRNAEYSRNEALFAEVYDAICDDIEILSFPEEVYEYEMSQDALMEYGMQNGYSYDQVLGMYDDEDSELLEELTQEKEKDLEAEMIIRCMAQDLGIEEPSENAWTILMCEKTCFNTKDLYSYYTEEELQFRLLAADVVETVAEQTNTEPRKYYRASSIEEVEAIDKQLAEEQ